jgi:predicted RNA-binding Zn-ribbon protein involved in translation (DUF1610 family)
MKRKKYPNLLRSVIPKITVLAFFTVLPIFPLYLALEHYYPNSHFSSILCVAALIVFGLGLNLWLRFIYTRMPCPDCGRPKLTQCRTEDKEAWHLLICQTCEVEWMTGLGDNTE